MARTRKQRPRSARVDFSGFLPPIERVEQAGIDLALGRIGPADVLRIAEEIALSDESEILREELEAEHKACRKAERNCWAAAKLIDALAAACNAVLDELYDCGPGDVPPALDAKIRALAGPTEAAEKFDPEPEED